MEKTEHLLHRRSRLLLLTSKTIQNVTNLVLYGEKESHLKPLNAAIERHLEPMRSFIDHICCLPMSEEGAGHVPVWI